MTLSRVIFSAKHTILSHFLALSARNCVSKSAEARLFARFGEIFAESAPKTPEIGNFGAKNGAKNAENGAKNAENDGFEGDFINEAVGTALELIDP
jgi:hypothetical protein